MNKIEEEFSTQKKKKIEEEFVQLLRVRLNTAEN